ncbi:MAG: hypothetical protein ACK2UM_01670 [Anaerolineales bacterium]
MTITSQKQLKSHPRYLNSVECILVILGIVCGITLMDNFFLPWMGLALLWMTTFARVGGGIAIVFLAFQPHSARFSLLDRCYEQE